MLGNTETILVVAGFNGHVGEHSDGFNQCHGGKGYGVRSEDGVRLLEFADAAGMVITNTMLIKRPSHLITYSSGGCSTQVDYFLTQHKHLNCVLDTKVIPSCNIMTQHQPVIIDFRLQHRVPKGPLQSTRRESNGGC